MIKENKKIPYIWGFGVLGQEVFPEKFKGVDE